MLSVFTAAQLNVKVRQSQSEFDETLEVLFSSFFMWQAYCDIGFLYSHVTEGCKKIKGIHTTCRYPGEALAAGYQG